MGGVDRVEEPFVVGTRHEDPPEAPAATPTLLVAPTPNFESFFRTVHPSLVRLLTALTGDRAVAEELTQETLLRAHLRWGRVSTMERPEAWVRRVAINLATNSWARRRTERRLVERLRGETSLNSAVEIDDSSAEFWAVVRQLPDRQAAAVTLHYLEDRSVAEVAVIMDCALGTAKAHLHKGRNKLAEMLDQEVYR